jgi:CRP/FNR family transcriptional regulator, anaerobic regulatory protein
MLATVIRSEADRFSTAVRIDHLAALDRIGTIVSLRRGETLFREGDAARHHFKLVTGATRTCKLLADGRRYIGGFSLRGDFLGLESDDTYRFTVEAVSDVTLMRYLRAAVERLVEEEPRLGRRLLDLLSNSLSIAQAQMMLLGRKNAIERIASFLLAMSEREGDHDRISLPMTRADIADHLGLTTETVSRIFTALRTSRFIELVETNQVVISRPDALADLADAACASEEDSQLHRVLYARTPERKALPRKAKRGRPLRSACMRRDNRTAGGRRECGSQAPAA